MPLMADSSRRLRAQLDQFSSGVPSCCSASRESNPGCAQSTLQHRQPAARVFFQVGTLNVAPCESYALFVIRTQGSAKPPPYPLRFAPRKGPTSKFDRLFGKRLSLEPRTFRPIPFRPCSTRNPASEFPETLKRFTGCSASNGSKRRSALKESYNIVECSDRSAEKSMCAR